MGIAGTIQMPELDDIPEGEGTNWQLACTEDGFAAIAPDGGLRFTTDQIQAQESPNIKVQLHVTGTITADDSEQDLMDAVRATGILIITGDANSGLSGQFACNRNGCVALGVGTVMTNTKDEVYKVNIYYGADEKIKLQNDYQDSVFHIMFLSTGVAGLNTSL